MTLVGRLVIVMAEIGELTLAGLVLVFICACLYFAGAVERRHRKEPRRAYRPSAAPVIDIEPADPPARTTDPRRHAPHAARSPRRAIEASNHAGTTRLTMRGH